MMGFLRDRLLLSNKKEQIIVNTHNLDESQKPYSERRKPVSKGYTVIMHDSTYMTFSNKEYYSNGQQINGC